MVVDAFIQHFKRITTFLFLHGAYYLGIGFTSVAGKIFRIPFFPDTPRHSTWVKHHDSEDFTKMF